MANSKRITVSSKEIEVYEDCFAVVGDRTGRTHGIERVRPENRAMVAAAMAEVAAINAADPAIIAHREEQRLVDELYLSEDRIYQAMGARR